MAFDSDETAVGMLCIAAGVRDDGSDGGRPVAGLSLSTPAERFDVKGMGLLRKTAEEISAALG